MPILALNSGSSSLKFALYDMRQVETRLLAGTVSGIGGDAPSASVTRGTGEATEERLRAATPASALEWMVGLLEREGHASGIRGAGHRLVHGGSKFEEPVRLTPAIVRSLRELVPLAPLHLPRELGALEALSRLLPTVPQVACFDTAFHRSMPRVAQWFGLPRALAERGVQRYGFHGLSCEYVVDHLRRDGRLARRVVIAHLGSGASLTAVRDGASIDTSMGLTPNGGFLMSTRSGDLDPGVLLYLMRADGLSVDQAAELVSTRSGLLGVSDRTGDMRELLEHESTDARAADAVNMFCYGVRRFLGAYTAALGGLDTLVFTGGIGERAPVVRERICHGLEALGIELDAQRNQAGATVVSREAAAVTVRVIGANEELMIARHAARLLA
ncbi:MAG TPA: acetate/propionate family kinase [Gemmatimonadaceae bacterium]|nr:acetate/propionate family kinase [Gemmatimonadaceae bacterium]